MKKSPRISDTEWEIMHIIWTSHPISAADIIARLAKEDASWHPKTARALLNRLVSKKALSYEARGRVYYYAPLVGEAESVASESASFLDRVFRGSFTPMLAHFVERHRIKSEDLDELRQLLSTAESDVPQKSKKKK